MCGICGSVGRADERLIEAMNSVQAHRGPDGSGVELFPAANGGVPVALGHRRLSILDLTDRGAQPMSYADGRYWITYNGEVYNYKELRNELEADGYRFRSATDTEVVLALYARDGERMLEKLNGMFAFAIFDRERSELFMARDRLGIKPLYYALHDGVLYFASEVKAILEAIPHPALNEAVLGEYLSFLWVPDPDTLFRGVFRLPPGHCARHSNGKLRVREYWDMQFEVERGVPMQEWSNRIRHAVSEAVRRQMVSDVPLGAFLSGGLDSGAVVASMRAATDEVTCYTAGFSEEDLPYEIVPNDVRYARLVASELGLEHHVRILEADIVELLPRLIWHMDEPVADPAMITTYLICAAARERLTVVLSGMGGDELFAGYPRYLAARLGRAAELLPQDTRRRLRGALDRRLTMGVPGRLRGPRRNLMKFVRGLDQPHLERYLTFSSYYRAEELSGLLADGVGDGGDPFAAHRRFASRAASGDWLDQLLYVDLKTFLPCLNLTYTDKMGMAASTEVRVPLLDDELVALAARVPARLKLHGFTRKYALKRSMRGVLPTRVIWRPKAGFGAPVRAWLGRELRPMVDDLLGPERVRRRGLFDPAAVRELIRRNDEGSEDNALRIWALLVLELWQQQFLDG
jgi:asparagine synthase (glutamine-hydrolysing)